MKNNNLIDLFEELKINDENIEKNKVSNKNKSHDNMDLAHNNEEDNLNRFRIPLNERLKGRMGKSIIKNKKIYQLIEKQEKESMIKKKGWN